jgi:hypothetical protein
MLVCALPADNSGVIHRIGSWHVLAFVTALAGVTIGPQLPREVVLIVPPVLVAGFVIGYASALRETARSTPQ